MTLNTIRCLNGRHNQVSSVFHLPPIPDHFSKVTTENIQEKRRKNPKEQGKLYPSLGKKDIT